MFFLNFLLPYTDALLEKIKFLILCLFVKKIKFFVEIKLFLITLLGFSKLNLTLEYAAK